MVKRTEKISCFISKPARTALDKACFNYDSPQGKLISRMILSFCGDNQVDIDKRKPKPKKSPTKKFKPPTVEEVFNYCKERCNNINANQFVNHYTTNGWVQGKGKPIVSWKACVRTWEENDKDKQNQLGKNLSNVNDTKWAENLDDVL